MKYYSTRNKNEAVAFSRAVLNGIAPDGGLYIPGSFPVLNHSVTSSLLKMEFFDLAFEIIKPYVKEEIPDAVLQDIIHSAFNFPAPLAEVEKGFHILELFHGPTAAFKDFGARFMARVFSYLRRSESKPLRIIVATSGDTGGAVADGFFDLEGVYVTVLYPKGRISPLQEKQIAGLGGNISAIAVEGGFDECQALAKEAFVTTELKRRMELSSANSINIARLLPQIVYYGSGSVKKPHSVFCVPSGNFGNLTAGLYGQKMGLPVKRFIAATNINKTFVDYIKTGSYSPKKSVQTISTAMDVGAPSNFERINAHWTHKEIVEKISAHFITDEETLDAIKTVKENYGYILDPHGAVGWAAAKREELKNENVVILETAHPSKFSGVVEPVTGPVPMPEALKQALSRKISNLTIPPKFDALLDVLEKI
ncbi:MAG: threonine synthase [Spirochaetaceae bacterium]|jgi:threonine synthase|nr:threonine synthase [Spirochaetaceae bacterium]